MVPDRWGSHHSLSVKVENFWAMKETSIIALSFGIQTRFLIGTRSNRFEQSIL